MKDKQPPLSTPQSAKYIRDRIREDRERFQPSPVRSGHVPEWVGRRLRKAMCGMFYSCGSSAGAILLQIFRAEFRARWVDHVGSIAYQGRVAMVAEPYGVEESDLPSILEFARMAQCSWFVSANSWHRPGDTLRIVFYQPDPQ